MRLAGFCWFQSVRTESLAYAPRRSGYSNLSQKKWRLGVGAPNRRTPKLVNQLGSLNIMAANNCIVANVADLQDVIERIRVEVLSVSVAEFLGRTDDDAIDDLNLIHEALLAVLSETSRSQRKSRKVSTSAPGAAVTATAIATVSM